MDKNELLQVVSDELGLVVKADDFAKGRLLLSDRINELLNTDFQKLVSILYRMDISEPKLKSLLKDNRDADAGLIIADMMIERQEQKIKSRKENIIKDGSVSDEERW